MCVEATCCGSGPEAFLLGGRGVGGESPTYTIVSGNRALKLAGERSTLAFAILVSANSNLLT